MTNVKPFFILGCPRSGTTLLQVLLNRHREILIPPELKLFFSFYNHARQTRLSTVQRINADLQISISEEFAELRYAVTDVYDELIRQYCERCIRKECVLFGDKTPEHVFRLAYIRHVFPSAKIVGVIRDPRDVVPSLMRVPWIRCNIPSAAQIWKSSYLCLLADSQNYPDYFHWVRFEELIEAPHQTLKGVLNFLSATCQETESLLAVDLESDVSVIPDRERSWKENACGPLLLHKAYAWQQDYQAHVREIETSLSTEMEQADYVLSSGNQETHHGRAWSRLTSVASLARTVFGLSTQVWAGEFRYQYFRLRNHRC